MEQPILITWLNDYIFCPVSIYFHNLYGEKDSVSFQEASQINGTAAHSQIDSGSYSTRTNIISGISVYCEEYGLIGKIDIFDKSTGVLCERKKKIKNVYDGYVFQLFGQYFALSEMGYTVKELVLRSLEDNKTYSVDLPENNTEMFEKFKRTVTEIKSIDIIAYKQSNQEKCSRCIYEPLCDSSLLNEATQ